MANEELGQIQEEIRQIKEESEEKMSEVIAKIQGIPNKMDEIKRDIMSLAQQDIDRVKTDANETIAQANNLKATDIDEMVTEGQDLQQIKEEIHKEIQEIEQKAKSIEHQANNKIKDQDTIEKIKDMKDIKKKMEEDSKTQKKMLENPQENPQQPVPVIQKEAKQQARKVKEQIHKIHERLKIQLGLVQKIEQLQQDLIPLERKQGEKFKELHDDLNKKANKFKAQATSIQSECTRVHEKFMKAVEIEKKAKDIKQVEIDDITPLRGDTKEETRQIINKQGDVIKAHLLVQEIQRIQHEVTEVEQKAHRILWDEYYMKLACLAALRSKDPSTPVGACIAEKNFSQVVGIGYNAMPHANSKNNDEIFPWKGAKKDKNNPTLKYSYVVHAAVNAIINKTKESVEGCTIYLTHIPDDDCAHAIIKAGIKEVVYCMYTRHEEREKKDDITRAKKLLEDSSIELRKMDNDDKVAGDLKTRMEEIGRRYKVNEPKWPTGPVTDFISWEAFFMKIALISKERSTHPEYKVGACVVSPHNQVMSIGYNAYPEDMDHSTTGTEEKEESPYMSHAEYKAIIGIPPSVRDCTLYVTQYPCNMCAKVIVQAGITKVVYDKDGGWNDPKYISSRKILTTCLGPDNVENIRKYDKDSFGANPS